MATINRRRVLQLLGSAPLAAGFVWTETEVLAAQQRTQQARRAPAYKPSFFTAHEFATVSLLAEIIIPKDERSVGAGEAGVPQFMDFMMLDQECNSRFNTTFVASTDVQRTAVLDDISGLEPPSPDLSHGIAFFRSCRDLVATGFWTSKAGIADLQFTGNVFVAEWNGCPDEALKKLGIE